MASWSPNSGSAIERQSYILQEEATKRAEQREGFEEIRKFFTTVIEELRTTNEATATLLQELVKKITPLPKEGQEEQIWLEILRELTQLASDLKGCQSLAQLYSQLNELHEKILAIKVLTEKRRVSLEGLKKSTALMREILDKQRGSIALLKTKKEELSSPSPKSRLNASPAGQSRV